MCLGDDCTRVNPERRSFLSVTAATLATLATLRISFLRCYLKE